MVDIPEIYDKLAEKYKFILERMETISIKVDNIQKELKELHKIITNTILEVTIK